MKGKRLYQHLRECGIKATLQEAFQLRETWLRTFKEMNLHFARTPLRQDPRERYAWIPASDDDTSTEDADPKADKRKGRQLYEVTTITGFRRNRTVINSCLNTEFQNPVAHLAKEALWNFERAGLGSRLLNLSMASWTLKKVNCWECIMPDCLIQERKQKQVSGCLKLKQVPVRGAKRCDNC